MAARVLESLVVPSPPTAAPRTTAVLSPLTGRGPRAIPRFSGLRCASLPPRITASRSRAAASAAVVVVVCEEQETAVQLPNISKDTWQTGVLGSDVPVLVDFWAPWCGPCRMIEPTIAKLAKVYEGKLKCYKLNRSISTARSRFLSPTWTLKSDRCLSVVPTGDTTPRHSTQRSLPCQLPARLTYQLPTGLSLPAICWTSPASYLLDFARRPISTHQVFHQLSDLPDPTGISTICSVPPTHLDFTPDVRCLQSTKTSSHQLSNLPDPAGLCTCLVSGPQTN